MQVKKVDQNNQTNWKVSKGKLVRQIEFKSFMEAIAFVKKIAVIAEKLQHHPDIKIHDYKMVTLETSTHEENAITEKDYELAKRIDELISNW